MRLLLTCALFAAATLLFTFGEAGSIQKTKNSTPKDDSRSYLININGETFYVGEGRFRWNETQAQCELLGMQMMTFSTQERWLMIRDWFIENQDYDAHTWTAGQKLAGQNQFMWMSTDENFAYTDWNIGEPSALTDEDSCVDFIGLFDGEISGWDDDSCELFLRPMCEAVNMK